MIREDYKGQEVTRRDNTTGAIPRQADSDNQIIGLWLHGRSSNTMEAYRSDAERLRAFIGKPLHSVTLRDLQEFADTLSSLAPATQCRILSSVKSLFTCAYRLGYLQFNVGGQLRLPGIKSKLAERILPETDVQRMLALEPKPRNRALLRLLYAGGLRVSEICGLTWQDAASRDNAGQITVYGKGDKTRAVLLSADTWKEIAVLRGDAAPDEPVFRSQKGGPLDRSQVIRIVRAAAKRAGIDTNVSPHWLRHAHASHALDRGCPIHLVQATLGHASVATTGRYLHARPSDSSARYLPV
ncbi:MAG: tyrosine-type recombinase/integrase [bacterium]|nr:tyrosine-type recombinase/integrase [bacterium]